jgi:exodeoxyribonuclease V alpha subunit
VATHVSVRLYWHDHGWDGAICQDPRANVWCEAHEHIREYKDVEAEAAEAGRPVANATAKPPCEGSIQAFSRSRNKILIYPPEWMAAQEVRPIEMEMEPVTSTMWPFEDMWDEDGAHKDNEVRRAIAERFFKEVRPKESLVFFYVDERNPMFVDVGERSPSRVLVGISRLADLGEIVDYADPVRSGEYNMVWAVPFGHAYPKDGVRLPLQALLAAVPDASERQKYLVALAGGIRTDFRYGSSRVSLDRALAVLEAAHACLLRTAADGVISVDLTNDVEWINERILEVWKERGPYPGLGAVLLALGCERGAHVQRTVVPALLNAGEDPAVAVFDALDGGELHPVVGEALGDEYSLVRAEWDYMDSDDRELAGLLARMELGPSQVKRFLNSGERVRHRLPSQAAALLENPYLIAERYVPPKDEDPIAFLTVDHALLPHEQMALSQLGRISPRDARRFRCVLVESLRADADDGHTFARVDEARDAAVTRSPSDRPCDVPVERVSHPKMREVLDPALDQFLADGMPYLALHDVRQDELLIREKLQELAERTTFDAFKTPWQEIADDLSRRGVEEVSLSEEQQAALDRVFTSPLSVITGAAGTGKSTLLSPLLHALELTEGRQGVRALTPTGKAADRLKEIRVEAMTIHRALASADWFDWHTGTFKPESDGRVTARTLIIDEASMVDVRLLATLFRAIAWDTVRRLILVGDHHQLPPIGPGRPFYDLIAEMRVADDRSEGSFKGRPSELTHNYRVSVEGSKAIALANGFAGQAEPDEALIWEALARGEDQGDLRIRYWDDTTGLHEALLTEIVELCRLEGERSNIGDALYAQFNALLGHHADYDAAFWQTLGPVHDAAFGTRKLNAVIQDHFHRALKISTAKRWGVKFGKEQITAFDKVIQIANEQLPCYDMTKREKDRRPVFNGQLGRVVSEYPVAMRRFRKAERGPVKLINVEFDGMEGVRFGYSNRGWQHVDRHLELAYAITVHKGQGSQFRHVFFVVPRQAGSFIGRELAYTGLTRARDSLTLFIEKDVLSLLPLKKLAAAQTPRRNSRLFSLQPGKIAAYRPENLIQVSARGELMRSKSEVIVANRLHDADIDYAYEKELIPPGGDERDMRLPDFTINIAGAELYWEHCGKVDDEAYMDRWNNTRLPWYKKHGFADRLIVTYDLPGGAIDTTEIDRMINERIQR